MNANQIHIGDEYAVYRYQKPNNFNYAPPYDVFRVKVMRVFGEDAFTGARRTTMYVNGWAMDHETGQPLSTEMKKYRVRDILCDWDEYEDLRDQAQVEEEKRRKEREEQDRIWREEREERERKRRQEIEEKERRIRQLKERLAEVGLPNAQVDSYSNIVRINLIDLEQWLAGLQKVECVTCNKQLLQIPSLRGL